VGADSPPAPGNFGDFGDIGDFGELLHKINILLSNAAPHAGLSCKFWGLWGVFSGFFPGWDLILIGSASIIIGARVLQHPEV
jgi:hypothetical protein